MADPTILNIDRAAAADFLGALFNDMPPPDVAPIGAGAWSRAYSYSRNGCAYVIRFAAVRDDFERDRIAGAFSSAALPVPRTVAIGEAFDGYYSITERAYGQFLEQVDGANFVASFRRSSRPSTPRDASIFRVHRVRHGGE